MGRRKRELKIRVAVASDPMSATQQAAAERILAVLVARAYAADNPHLLQPTQASAERSVQDGPADESSR